MVTLVAWLVGALAFTALGGLRLAPPPLPQLILVGLLALLLAAYAARPGLRAWLHGLPLAALIALHLSRAVGLYFLVLHGRGELPYDFAVIGGWGDVLVALLAAILLAAPPRARGAASPWLHAWNLLGLTDIVWVVATAARNALTVPGSMDPLTTLPLGLLPTFLVPLIIFTHLVILLAGIRALSR